MIIADNITKYYQVQGKRKTVFENLSLQLNPGDRLALMGPNGAGKSTLLRLLCGVERPNSGKVIRTSSLSWPIGINSGFISNLTGRENIKFACRLFGYKGKEKVDKVNFVQDFAEIGDHFDMPMATYSTGMRGRLAFGMSMAFDFDFYVVDEVLAAGDPAFKSKCAEYFKQKVKNKGLIMVSHSVGLVKKFCNQGLYLHQGTLTFSNNIELIVELYQNMTGSHLAEERQLRIITKSNRLKVDESVIPA